MYLLHLRLKILQFSLKMASAHSDDVLNQRMMGDYSYSGDESSQHTEEETTNLDDFSGNSQCATFVERITRGKIINECKISQISN